MCLLAELYLNTSQPERAIAIINSLEKVIFSKKEGEEPAPGDTMTDRQIEEWRLKIALVRTSYQTMNTCAWIQLSYNHSVSKRCYFTSFTQITNMKNASLSLTG